MKYSPVQNYINGQFVDASSSRTLDVISPLDGNLLSKVPMSSSKDLDNAVKAAKAAFPKWSHTPIKDRVQVFYKYKYLLEKNLQELSALVSEENGKTIQKNINSSAASSFLNSHDPIAIKKPISGERIQIIFKTLSINIVKRLS